MQTVESLGREVQGATRLPKEISQQRRGAVMGLLETSYIVFGVGTTVGAGVLCLVYVLRHKCKY